MGSKVRIPRMSLSIYGINYLHRRNPWAAAWWSAAMPGFGHIYLGSYMKGFSLLFWELVVNLKANINMAIIYTFTGNFNKINEVVDFEYLLFYATFYMFGIWDSFRLSIQINRLSQLEEKQANRYYQKMVIGPGGINSLDLRTPWVAALWAMFFGGSGHLYNQQAIKSFIIMSFYLIVTLKAHIMKALMLTFTGHFHQVTKVVDYQWLLFWPTIFVFNIWDAFLETVELNKLNQEELLNYWNDQCGSLDNHETVKVKD